MKRKYKIGLGIIILLIVVPLIYLAYDRSLMPPKPEYKSPPYIPGETWEQYATRFLAISKKPNALEHYLKAYSLFTTQSFVKSEGIYDIQTILNIGWTKPYPAVEKMLQNNYQAIQEIILGAQMKQCEFPPETYGEKAPRLQDYFKSLYLSRLIIIQGKKLELDNKFQDALQCYLSEIQFGKDLGGKNQPIISVLISVGCVQYGVKALHQLISQNKSTEPDYRQIIQELNRIDQDKYNLVETFLADYQAYYGWLYQSSTSSMALAKEVNYRQVNASSNFKDNLKDTATAIYLYFNRGRILRHFYDNNAVLLSALTTKSYQEIMKIDWATKQSRDLINQPETNSFYWYKRVLLATSQLRIAQIQAAIQLYHLEKKQLPKGLDDLKPYLSPIPIDPFTDKPFLWSRDSTGRPYYAKASKGKPFAYSTGPDFKDDSAKILYDPTNGTTSAGDIMP